MPSVTYLSEMKQSWLLDRAIYCKSLKNRQMNGFVEFFLCVQRIQPEGNIYISESTYERCPIELIDVLIPSISQAFRNRIRKTGQQLIVSHSQTI